MLINFSLMADVITKTGPKLPVQQLFFFMPRRKRPIPEEEKEYLGKRVVKKPIYFLAHHISLNVFFHFS
jgi:hypothetical protein